jgi:hypothetical protein
VLNRQNSDRAHGFEISTAPIKAAGVHIGDRAFGRREQGLGFFALQWELIPYWANDPNIAYRTARS